MLIRSTGKERNTEIEDGGHRKMGRRLVRGSYPSSFVRTVESHTSHSTLDTVNSF